MPGKEFVIILINWVTWLLVITAVCATAYYRQVKKIAKHHGRDFKINFGREEGKILMPTNSSFEAVLT